MPLPTRAQRVRQLLMKGLYVQPVLQAAGKGPLVLACAEQPCCPCRAVLNPACRSIRALLPHACMLWLPPRPAPTCCSSHTVE